MKIFVHPDQRLHDPMKEFTGNGFRPYPESPERLTKLLSAVEIDSMEVKEPPLVDISSINAVHDTAYVEFLRHIPDDTQEVAPTAFAIPNPRTIPSSTFSGQLGAYFFDPSTPVTKNTYISALASASSAISGVDDLLHNNSSAIALCRPPGHHASHHMGGGYWFFNDAAIAANYLMKKGKTSISILDLDYHHGNGTQEIFYNSSKVQYISIHANPDTNYPYFWGSVKEIGSGEGSKFNINLPIDQKASEHVYQEALTSALHHISEYNPDIVLVSMGFDTYYKDPIAGMKLSAEFYQNIGEQISNFDKFGIILEGGYHVDDLGTCFSHLLAGLRD